MVTIPSAGYGTMTLTAKASPQPIEESVKTLVHIYDKFGVRLFNGAIHYTFNPKFNNTDIFIEFFKQRPDPNIVYVYKLAFENMAPNLSEETIDKHVKGLLDKFSSLEVKPKIIIENSRVDHSIPVETWVKSLYKHVENGFVDGIGLSEVGAETIKKAAAVAPISTLEIELSMLTQDPLYNGILETASELQIPILCYSPMTRGILTDYAYEKENYLESLGPDDIKVQYGFDRFQPENFNKNRQNIKPLYDLAKSKGGKLEQLAIAYIYKLSEQTDFKGIKKVTQLVPIPGGSSIERVDLNYKKLTITDEEFDFIQDFLDNLEVAGGRYNDRVIPTLNG